MYLVEDPRIEEAALRDLDAGLLLEVALLAGLVRRLARRKERARGGAETAGIG